MKPEEAINHPIGYGPYQGRTIGWIAKIGRLDGLNWMFRAYTTAKLSPETLEAIRSFFAAPKYAPWLKKVMPSYPGPEPFWLLPDTKGCRACGGAPFTVSLSVPCSHGTHRGYRHVVRCPCGWIKELRDDSTRMTCEMCDQLPLFAGKLP